MKIPENHPKCNNLLIVKKCAYCNELIEEIDKFIVETREEIEYCISHGICKPCLDKQREEIKQMRMERIMRDVEAMGLPRKNNQ